MGVIRRLQRIGNHPLNRSRTFAALARVARWQIGTRILPSPSVVPFTKHTRLLVSRGMTGATGNVYCGLHDFEEMCFLLHFLRPDDTFVDVGANVGTYTVLASGEVGASTVSIEPVPETFERLLDNIYLNRLHERVIAHNCGAGDQDGTVGFTSDQDTQNHVATDAKCAAGSIEVKIRTLDDILASKPAHMLKVDVEGFEGKVVAGAGETLASASLQAVVMELNNNANLYGGDPNDVHQQMLQLGFRACRYDPLNRSLQPMSDVLRSSRNTLYIRDAEAVRARLTSAPSIEIRHQAI